MSIRKIALLPLIACFYVNSVAAQSVSYSPLFDHTTFSRSIDLSKPVGAIDGAAGTSPSGAATYTIPIKMPPGTNGMAPQLSIVYNSQGGNGILGQGWSLSGLSVITRAGKDFYHDGKVAPATYTNDDAFVLDGQRLVATSGSSGAPGTTYRTEAESYAVITSNESIGEGPRYFNVVSKDGTLMQYGYTDDARFVNDDDTKIMMWRLNKIQDVNGNYISFHYDNSDREPRLVKISYTGNADAGLSPYNEINFIYRARIDGNQVYDAGSSLNSTYLLWQIKVKGEGGDLFKTYQFNYGKNRLRSSYLKSVEEFASDNSKLNDTRFKYGEATPDMEVKSSNIDITYRKPLSDYSNPDIISGDFDGDGKSEMLVAQYDLVDVDYYDQIFNKHYKSFAIYKQSSSTSSDVYVPLAGGSDSWSAAGKHLISFKQSNSSKSFVVSDFDGDGKDDLFFFRNTNLSGYPPMSKMEGTTIYYSRVNSSGFYFDKIDYSAATLSMPYGGEPHLLPGKNKVVLGDFDGDKRTDYLYFTQSSEYYGGVTHYTDNSFVSFPGKGELNNRLMQTGTPSWDDGVFTRGFMNNDVYVLDFDGDGISELMTIETSKSQIFKVSKSASGNYYFEKITELGYPRGDHHDIYGIGDFNADGKDDLITRVKSTNDWEIGFSSGKILAGYRFDLNPSYMFQNMCGAYPADRLYIGDYNGDGKSDLLHESCDCGNYRTKSTFNAYYFNGVGIDNKMKYTMKSYAYANKAMTNSVTEIRPIITDLNGDGKNEISFKTEYDNEMQTLYLNKEDKSHLLEKVTDGLNRTTEFIYDPLTKGGDIYTKGSGEVYPVNNVQYPIYVVTSLKTPDGIGGISTTAFRYENLRLHRAGRGLLGFEKTRTINFTTGFETQTQYALNTEFYVPYFKSSKTFLSRDPSVYSLSTNNYSFTRIGSGYCFTQTNPSGSTEDLLTGRSSSYSNTYDADGNITNSTSTLNGDVTITTTTATSYTKVAGSPFFNAPSEITVTTQRDSKPSVMDKTTMEYDARGRLIKSYTMPDGITDVTKRLTKFWEYDHYGNKTVEKAWVLGFAYTPYTKYGYDDLGRFVKKKTNGPDHLTALVTDYTTHK
ncbi:MAG: hypothetical protein JNL13_13270, partial [Chitinophagaceae bacterium]|nr:hypothetical protein [Chitinophagaceae bacterium]